MKMKRNEDQIQEFANEVARDAWKQVNQAYKGYRDEIKNVNPEHDDECTDCIDCGEYDVYLYVYGNGNWTIEGSQYLTDHRDIVAAVPIYHVNGPAELAEEIVNEYEWNEQDSDEEEASESFRCDQCEAAMINGVFCHETGCPNSHSRYDAESDTWIKQRECFECGCTVDADDPCCSSND